MPEKLSSEKVVVADVTLREHGQNVQAKDLHRFDTKLRIGTALGLIAAGIKKLEIASCVSSRVAPAMEPELIKEVAWGVGRHEDVAISTLVPNRKGLATFQKLGLGPDGLGHTAGLFFSAVEEHNRANLGRSISESMKEARCTAVEANTSSIPVVAYLSAAFGYRPNDKGPVLPVSFELLHSLVLDLFDMGACTVTLSDLQGVASPSRTKETLSRLLSDLGGPIHSMIGYHAHHADPEQGLLLVKAAFESGVRMFDASLGATGGCITKAPGNVPTEGVVELMKDLGKDPGVDLQKLYQTSLFFQAQTKTQ